MTSSHVQMNPTHILHVSIVLLSSEKSVFETPQVVSVLSVTFIKQEAITFMSVWAVEVRRQQVMALCYQGGCPPSHPLSILCIPTVQGKAAVPRTLASFLISCQQNRPCLTRRSPASQSVQILLGTHSTLPTA